MFYFLLSYLFIFYLLSFEKRKANPGIICVLCDECYRDFVETFL